MTLVRIIVAWCALSLGLGALWVLAVLTVDRVRWFKRWTQPPSPEQRALAELERLYRLRSFRGRRVT